MKKVYLRTICTAFLLSALTCAGPLYAAPGDDASTQEATAQDGAKIEVDGDALMVAYDAAIAEGKSPEEAMVVAIQQVSATVFSSAIAAGYEGDTAALEATIATQVVSVMSVEISAKTGVSVAEAQSTVVGAYNDSNVGPKVSATEVAAATAVIISTPTADKEPATENDAEGDDVAAESDDAPADIAQEDAADTITQADLQETQQATQEHAEATEKEEESGSNI